MPEEFKYTSLKEPGSDLRLIQIACGQQEDELVCSLTVYSQHTLQHASYNALSYTWGDVAIKVPITLNGNIFFVTPNLEAALRNTRCSTEGERGRQLPLWVDAICINQTDIEERDDQVRRMKDIYESAEWVIIWLGNYHEPCDETFVINESRWGIDDSGREPEADTGAATQLALCLGYMLDDPLKDQTFPDGTKAYPSEVQNLKAWVQLARLFQRPWFERLWVIQEITVSQRAMVLCGKFMILWSQLEAAAKYILKPRGIPIPAHLRKILPLMRAHRMAQISLKSMWYIDKKNILTVLYSTQEAKCLDPRDRLYAILGIVEDESDVEIDYSVPVEQVYRNWAENRIRRTKNLDILSACSDSSRLGDLPSWVPDLRRPFGRDKPLWIFSHISGDRQLFQRFRPKQNNRECNNLQISPDGLILSVHGYQTGFVTHLSTVGDLVSNLRDPTDLKDMLRHTITRWKQEGLAPPSPGPVSGRFSWNVAPITKAMMRHVGPWSSTEEVWEPGVLDTWIATQSDTWSLQKDKREFERYLFPRIHGCQIFDNTEGEAGAVSETCQAQVGDEIWILQGGLTPFILRRVTSSTHRLISPCYLSGSMGCIAGILDRGKKMSTVNLI